MEVPETDAETVGGLVLDLLGRLAKPGDSVTINGHRLTVIRADPTRIRKIRLEPYLHEATSSSSTDIKGNTGKPVVDGLSWGLAGKRQRAARRSCGRWYNQS